MYTVPSMFLDELPEGVTEAVDLAGGTQQAIEHWRGGGAAAQQGWTDAGVRPKPVPIPPRARQTAATARSSSVCSFGTPTTATDGSSR